MTQKTKLATIAIIWTVATMLTLPSCKKEKIAPPNNPAQTSNVYNCSIHSTGTFTFIAVFINNNKINPGNDGIFIAHIGDTIQAGTPYSGLWDFSGNITGTATSTELYLSGQLKAKNNDVTSPYPSVYPHSGVYYIIQ